MVGRSTGYYVLILIVVLLVAESTVFTVVGFFNVLPFMSPPFRPAQLPWILTVPLLVGASLQPLSGKLSDVYGRRRVLLGSAVLCMAGSLLAALTTSYPLLIVARVLQAAVVALPGVNYAFVREFLPKRMIPVALGMLSTGIGISNLTAPLISGFLVSVWDYHAVFWFCFCYLAVLTPVVYRVIPDSTPGGTGNSGTVNSGGWRIDFAGAALLTAGLGTGLFTLARSAGEPGWFRLLGLVVAAGLLAAFVLVELRVPEPMLRLPALAAEPLRFTLLIGWFGGVALTGWIILVPQLLARPGAGLGRDATEIAVLTLPTGLAAIIFGPLGGHWSRRRSPRGVAIACAVLVIAATVPMALAHDQPWQFVGYGALLGAGQGLYYAALPNLMVDGVAAADTGVSGGLLAADTAIAASVMPVLFAAVLAARPDTGYSMLFWVLAGSALVMLLLALRMRHGRTPAAGGVSAAGEPKHAPAQP